MMEDEFSAISEILANLDAIEAEVAALLIGTLQEDSLSGGAADFMGNLRRRNLH
jgi:hypothetical protein